MKIALGLGIFLSSILLPVLSAKEPTVWWSPDRQQQASTTLHHEPSRPDRDDLTWHVLTVRDIQKRLLASLSLEKGSGINRALISTAVWSPDSRFFVFATTSSGGHSSWHMPTYVYDGNTSCIYSIDDTIGNTTDDNPQFVVSKPDVLKIRFWDGTKAEAEAAPRMIDLRDFVKKGPKLALNSHCHAPHHR